MSIALISPDNPDNPDKLERWVYARCATSNEGYNNPNSPNNPDKPDNPDNPDNHNNRENSCINMYICIYIGCVSAVMVIYYLTAKSPNNPKLSIISSLSAYSYTCLYI